MSTVPAAGSSGPSGSPGPADAAGALRIVVSNVPDEAAASRIARTLVDERLAACVNVLGACRSVYRWRGAIETAEEIVLLVKTTGARHDECVRRLAALHPYEVPEIVTLAPEQVWPAYERWAADETASGESSARGSGQGFPE